LHPNIIVIFAECFAIFDLICLHGKWQHQTPTWKQFRWQSFCHFGWQVFTTKHCVGEMFWIWDNMFLFTKHCQEKCPKYFWPNFCVWHFGWPVFVQEKRVNNNYVNHVFFYPGRVVILAIFFAIFYILMGDHGRWCHGEQTFNGIHPVHVFVYEALSGKVPKIFLTIFLCVTLWLTMFHRWNCVDENFMDNSHVVVPS
jgi:hypothetical protein